MAAVVVNNMGCEGHFTTNTNAVIIRCNRHIDRIGVIDIDRELIAQRCATTVIRHLNSEEVRVVRSFHTDL